MEIDELKQLGIFDWLMIILLCTFITFMLFGAVNAVMGIVYKEKLAYDACALCAQQHPNLMCPFPAMFKLNITS